MRDDATRDDATIDDFEETRTRGVVIRHPVIESPESTNFKSSSKLSTTSAGGATPHGDAGRAPARGRARTTSRRPVMPPADDVDEHIDPEDEIAFEDADAADREAKSDEDGSDYGSDEDFDATEVR